MSRAQIVFNEKVKRLKTNWSGLRIAPLRSREFRFQNLAGCRPLSLRVVFPHRSINGQRQDVLHLRGGPNLTTQELTRQCGKKAGNESRDDRRKQMQRIRKPGWQRIRGVLDDFDVDQFYCAFLAGGGDELGLIIDQLLARS